MNMNRRLFVGSAIVASVAPAALLPQQSALERVNTARLRSQIRATIDSYVESVAFEPADDITRQQFVDAVTEYLKDLQSRRVIHDYKVVCDDSNNPPSLVQRNQWNFDIFVKPQRSADVIHYFPMKDENLLPRAA